MYSAGVDIESALLPVDFIGPVSRNNPSVWVYDKIIYMPTVLRVDGFRVVVYPNDHRPPHVHVIGMGHEAVIELNCQKGPVKLRENYGFSRRELTQIVEMLEGNLGQLCAAWEGIHGID
jgi:hypothetical protein